jgi:hypothetical protein
MAIEPSNICRTCMHQYINTMHPPVNLKSIQQILSGENQILEITGVEVCIIIFIDRESNTFKKNFFLSKIRLNDNLPQTICESCVDQITHFRTFQNLCKATDTKLKEMFMK